jgi:hypothetical protein
MNPDLSFPTTPRLRREAVTMEAMLHRHCRTRHGAGSELCADCSELLAFSLLRLRRCPFGEAKGTCKNCSVHCWQGMKDRRGEIRSIMRLEGPRMLWSHPWLSLCHWLDSRRRFPQLVSSRQPQVPS